MNDWNGHALNLQVVVLYNTRAYIKMQPALLECIYCS